MAWISPFSLGGSWFKGNLHTHTTQSDGALTPEQAAAWYQEQGYDFLAITDHWVLTRGQVHGLTSDFITLSGAELHGSSYHLLTLGISELPDKARQDNLQEMVDAVLAQGGLPFIAHPYWTGQTSAQVAAAQRIAGIEVFNAVCERTRSLGYSRVHWDNILATGRNLWGLAVDDVHWRYNAQGTGFVMVKAPSLDEPSILEALRRGHFYASTGPAITDLRIVRQADGQLALRVHSGPCQTITFFASGPRGARFEAAPGGQIYTATLPLRREQVYLRVECENANGGVAWTNPVFIEDVLDN